MPDIDFMDVAIDEGESSLHGVSRDASLACPLICCTARNDADDALLAFERHATSKIKDAEDLLNIHTLGFRGEALPSIASVARVLLETRAPDEPGGTVVEIAGGKILRVEEAGLPQGTSLVVRDLFFNTPARKKFLKAESTELSHIASLVTHYALAHPEKHFELHSATESMLVAAPVKSH